MSDLLLRARLTRGSGQSDQAVKGDDEGRQVVADKYYELAQRGKVFTASVAAVTLPVNAATLASKFALYNPPGSGVFLDIMDVWIGAVVATTVVDLAALYYSNGTNATGATFTTAGVIQNARVGEGLTPNATFWAAATHVGTPALLDAIAGWGAVTDATSRLLSADKRGKILIPPSTLVSLAMTTAASTGSGVTAGIRWAEIPYVAV